MKKNVFCVLCVLFLTFVSCSKENKVITPAVTEEKIPVINLSENLPVKLIEGDSKEITISGEHIDMFVVNSSNSKVASISVDVKAKTFIIKAKTTGTATITVSSKNVSKSLDVQVGSKNILVESITFLNEQTKFAVGRAYNLDFKVLPEDATNKDLVWTSNNTKVVKVHQDGSFYVSVVENGEATITAKSTDGSNVSAEITILAVNPVRKIEFYLGETHTMAVGSEFMLGYELTALTSKFDPTDPTLSWKSSAPEIVSVTEQGKIKCLQEGEAQITATANDGFGAETNIFIKSINPINKIKVNDLSNGQTLSVKNKSKINLNVSTFLDDKLMENIVKGKSKSSFVSVRFFSRNESQNYMTEIKDGVLSVHKKGTFTLVAIYSHQLDPYNEVTCEIKINVTD